MAWDNLYLSMNSPFAGDFGTPNPSTAAKTELQLLPDEGGAPWVRCRNTTTSAINALRQLNILLFCMVAIAMTV